MRLGRALGRRGRAGGEVMRNVMKDGWFSWLLGYEEEIGVDNGSGASELK